MPRISRLRYLSSRPTGAGGSVLAFIPETAISFTAGQHGLWSVPGGGVMPFSIASAPADEYLELGTVLHGTSRMKSALAVLQAGDHVRFLGPLGHLSPPPSDRPVVFISQGIGITAVRSILRQPRTVPRTLIHVGDHHLRQETSTLVDHALYPEHRDSFARALVETVADQPDAEFLLTGTSLFVRETASTLRSAGITSRRIRRDPFYGSRDRTRAAAEFEAVV